MNGGQQNIMALHDVKLEDFTKEEQILFRSTLEQLGKSEEWGKKALQINKLEDWKKYGFGGMRSQWLIDAADKMVAGDTTENKTPPRADKLDVICLCLHEIMEILHRMESNGNV